MAAFDFTRVASAATAAEADLRAAAEKVASVNAEITALVRESREVTGDAAEARLLVRTDDAVRRLVLANAAYDKQVQVAAILATAARMRGKAEEALRRGNRADAEKLAKAAEALAAVLKGLKVPVSLPPRDGAVEDLRGFLLRGGLNGVGDLAFLKKLVRKAKTTVKSVGRKIDAKVTQTVLAKAEQAGKYVQKNGAKIGGTVGGVVSLLPGVGQIVGPAIIMGGALLQATAPKPKLPADPEAPVVVDPKTGLPLPTDAAGNPVPPPGMQIVTNAETGQPMVIPTKFTQASVLGSNIFLAVGVATVVGLIALLVTRRSEEPARVAG